LRVIPTSGGTHVTLASELATFERAQIWSDDSWLLRRPQRGGTPELLLTGQVSSGNVAASATDVYFVARPDLSSPYEVRAIQK
jgi:hypothetical protein